jgi:G3E family GTPase
MGAEAAPILVVLGVGRFDPVRAGLNAHAVKQNCTDSSCHDENHGHNHNGQGHSKVFCTWSYETDQPLALEALGGILGKLPGSVYRAKDVVYSSDAPQRRAVLQVVGRRVDISFKRSGASALYYIAREPGIGPRVYRVTA